MIEGNLIPARFNMAVAAIPFGVVLSLHALLMDVRMAVLAVCTNGPETPLTGFLMAFIAGDCHVGTFERKGTKVVFFQSVGRR